MVVTTTVPAEIVRLKAQGWKLVEEPAKEPEKAVQRVSKTTKK